MTGQWFDYFWTSPPDVPPGMGFGQFTPAHLVTLAVLAVGIAATVWAYCRSDQKTRRRMRLTIGIAVLIMELVFRQGIFIVLGIYEPSILPLHACAIATFCVGIDAFKPNSWTREYLYAVGTWGPLCALLFPDWDNQPIFNLYTFQAFLIHGCLLAYPLMLLVSKEFRPSARNLWKVVVIMAVFVGASLWANHVWGTNFWFLNSGSHGSPLDPIQNMAGPFYIPVLAVLVAILWTLMYLPWRRRNPEKHPSTSAS